MYTRSKKIVINEPIAVAVASIACMILVVSIVRVGLPLSFSLLQSRKLIAHYETLLDDSKSNRYVKDEIRKKDILLEKKHTDLTAGLGDAGNLAQLLQLIFDKAWESNIRFDKTTPQPILDGDAFIRYPVLLEMTAQYDQIASFIAAVEKMPQVMHVERLGLTVTKEGSVSAAIMVICYLSKEGFSGGVQ